jgi:hypothetical protein
MNTLFALALLQETTTSNQYRPAAFLDSNRWQAALAFNIRRFQHPAVHRLSI